MIYKENVYGFKQEQFKDTCIWYMYTLLIDRTNYILLKQGQYRMDAYSADT